jgi:2-oxoglutarate dehydrogenase E1 component
VVSKLSDFTDGTFLEVIEDSFAKKEKVKRVLLCSGKVYYDLLEKQESDNREDIAIIRVEQLYPLPEKELAKVFNEYKGAEFCWVQEEPKNMGTWMHLSRYDFPVSLKCISRKSSASPATGLKKIHDKEQNEIVKEAFSI